MQKEQENKEKNFIGLTFEEMKNLSEEDQAILYKRINSIRKDAKQVNFSAVYGVGPPKLSATTGWSIAKSKEMLNTYWKVNWSVKKIARDCVVKTIDDQMWLFNPVSRFWYSLRFDKDRFSTLNQSTGVFCFDTWIRHIRSQNTKLCGQFHDEGIIPLHKDRQEEVRQILLTAIDKANEDLKLNVTLGISIAFGFNYADIH